jgi:hypothetical protein
MTRSGYVLYEGPSLLDGKTPIVAIATFRSHNVKTGPMVQTWIIRQRVDPYTAVWNGRDAAVCGDCPYRGGNGCYVNIAHAPKGVWKAYRRGRYHRDLAAAAAACRGLKVRLGAYGDPAAVPTTVWQQLVRRAAGWTGYTHQWKSRRLDGLKRLVMASCDSPEDRRLAKARGWRTFRVRPRGAPRERGEAVCPASVEAGKRTDCHTCGGCNGQNGRTLDFVIDAHGQLAHKVELVQLTL